MDNRSINPFDIRMLNSYLKDNKITKEEYDSFVNSLEDLSDNIETVDVEMVENKNENEVEEWVLNIRLLNLMI